MVVWSSSVFEMMLVPATVPLNRMREPGSEARSRPELGETIMLTTVAVSRHKVAGRGEVLTWHCVIGTRVRPKASQKAMS